jgi:lysophospholipase L1-like esterase
MRFRAVVACALLLGGGWQISSPGAEEPVDRWEKTIAAFEAQDRQSPPAMGANLFVGSSTARLWKVEESFPEATCVNRGFGGSKLADVAKYVDRIVIAYRPQVIVLYAGDNDIAAGRTPQEVCGDYERFVARVQAALPESKIVWISIKPSPSRWKLREQAQEANALIRKRIAAGKNQTEIDIWAAMLGDNGEPRTELYVKDQLHLSPEGYAIWNERVRGVLVGKPAAN